MAEHNPITEIDQAVVENVAKEIAVCRGHGMREKCMDDAYAALRAINLPDLLRKAREYDALLARVEAAPEVTVGESPLDYLIFVDTRAVELQVKPLIGKRVRLLVEQEG